MTPSCRCHDRSATIALISSSSTCWCGWFRSANPGPPLRVNVNAKPWWAKLSSLNDPQIRERIKAAAGIASSDKRLFFIGPYLVGKQLGRGAFSKVRLGLRRNPTDGRWHRVALKFIFRSSVERERHAITASKRTYLLSCWDQALSELCLAHACYGPANLVRLQEILLDVSHGLWVAVMEYAGDPVMHYDPEFEMFLAVPLKGLKCAELFSEESAKVVLKETLTALARLHEECDVVHKDVKPSNILRLPTRPALTRRVIPLASVVRPELLNRSRLLKNLKAAENNNSNDECYFYDRRLNSRCATSAAATENDTEDEEGESSNVNEESDLLSVHSDCTEDFIWPDEEGCDLGDRKVMGPPPALFACLCCALETKDRHGTAAASFGPWKCHCCGKEGDTSRFTTMEDNDAEVTLVDLNSATQATQPDLPIYDAEGTRWFTSPECFTVDSGIARSGRLRDAWSVGCLAFTLLFGRPPFWSSSEAPIAMILSIKNDPLEWPPGIEITDRAKRFISSLLEKQPEKRMTILQALQDPWLS